MNERSLRVLEYPKILERIAEGTTFGPGREVVLGLEPARQLWEADWRQQQVAEMRAFLAEHVDFGLEGVRDIRPYLQRAERGGRLEPPELLEVAQTARAATRARRQLEKVAGQYPALWEAALGLEDFTPLERELLRAISPTGELEDRASPALARIRAQKHVTLKRLQEKMEVLRDRYRSALQEPIITTREGRYVLPVRAGSRNQVPGLVHDRSASGATLFIEPMEAVKLNNRRRELELEEAQEVDRILGRLTARVAAEARRLEVALEALARLDALLAIAAYADRIGGIRPQLLDAGHAEARLELYQARHPLLPPETVVPIDVVLGGDARILVVTGPNTGGKTVALKTVGLLTLMAQAGIPIPAREDSRLPVLHQVFADIGEEQSIEQSLSTFSSHLTHILEFLDRVDAESLVLLDELGAGTDPQEGAALARAILDELLARGCLAMISTHYPELKAYAHQMPGVANAAVEFDPQTLAPTYRLRIGLPGRSNALAIAERLGMPDHVLERARSYLGEEELRLESLLSSIQQEQDRARQARREAEAARREARALERRWREELRRLEAEREAILAEARREAEERIREIEGRLRRLERDLETATLSREWLRQARTSVQEAREAARKLTPSEEKEEKKKKEPHPPRPEGGPPDGALQPGDRVYVHSWGEEGTVLSAGPREVEVQIGGMTLRVKRKDVELRERARPRPARLRVRSAETPPPPVQLDLRGLRTAEVEPQLEAYLNEAYLAGYDKVRIVHGKGTGALRQLVRERLRSHPLVKSFRPGVPGEGGDGVTVVELHKEG